MTPLVAGLAAFVAVVAAAYLHEYTHVIAFKLLGGDASVDHWDLTVHWQMPDDIPHWRDRIGGLAPLLVGSLVAAVVVSTSGVPARSLETVWLWAGWGIYTVHGALSDYSMTVARSGSFVDVSDHWRRLLAAAGCVSVAMAGWTVLPQPDYYVLAYYVSHIYLAVFIGGMVLLLLSMRSYQPASPA